MLEQLCSTHIKAPSYVSQHAKEPSGSRQWWRCVIVCTLYNPCMVFLLSPFTTLASTRYIQLLSLSLSWFFIDLSSNATMFVLDACSSTCIVQPSLRSDAKGSAWFLYHALNRCDLRLLMRSSTVSSPLLDFLAAWVYGPHFAKQRRQKHKYKCAKFEWYVVVSLLFNLGKVFNHLNKIWFIIGVYYFWACRWWLQGFLG